MLAAIFGRAVLGSLVFVLMLATAIYGGIVNMRAERRLDGMREYASPMVRVKRGGNVYYTDGRNIVPGDVILLDAGDLVPCDARIVRCDSLFVDEILPEADGLVRRRVLKQKNVKYSDKDTVSAPDALNMLYAGSAIMHGDAIALVVSVADDVYLAQHVVDGALSGKDVELEAVKGLRPTVGKISFICAISLTVLSLIGFVTLRGKAEFISYFMMLLAPCLFITGEFLTFTAKHISSSYITRLSDAVSEKKNKDSAAAIRNVKALDKLTDVTDVVFFGTSGIFEGGYKFGDALVADKTFKTLEISDGDCERLLSYINTYVKAVKLSDQKNDLVGDGLIDALYGCVSASGFDMGGAALATKSLYFANDIKTGYGIACAETESSIYSITLTFNDDILNLSQYIRAGGELRELKSDDLHRIKRFGENASHPNLRKLYCVSECDGKKIFEGVITVYQSFDNGIGSAIKDMAAFGINSTVILATEAEENVRLVNSKAFKDIFGGKVALASEFQNDGKSILDSIGQYSAYVGFGMGEYAELITEMRNSGRRVLSFGVSGEFNEVMAKTDVVATCDVIKYSSNKYCEAIYENLPPEGRDTNVRASQQTRLLSRVIVRRAHSGGGGVHSLFNAIRTSRESSLALAHATLLFALLSVSLLAFCSMSIITGTVLLDPLQAVALSCAFAILSSTVFSDSRHKPDILTKRIEYKTYPQTILKSNIHVLISRASVVFITALTILILDIIGLFGENPTYTLPIYICLLITMCIEVLLIGGKHAKVRGEKSNSSIKVIITYAILLLIGAISALQPFAGEVFKNRFGSYEYLIIPGYMLLYAIALIVSHIIGKKQASV